MTKSDHHYQPNVGRRFRAILAIACVLVLGWSVRDRLALSSSAGQRIRFVHSFTTASERAIIDEAVAEFRGTHPGFEVDQIVFNSETYQTIGWRLQFQGDRQSDLFFTWQGIKSRQAIDRGWALNLSPYLSPGFVDQFVSESVGRLGDRIYLLPQSIDLSNLIWYNKDWFRTNQLAEPKSREAWLALSRRIQSAGALALVQGNREFWPMGNLGAELMGRSLGLTNLDAFFSGRVPADATTLRGLQLFVDWAKSGCFEAKGVLETGAIGAMSDLDAKVFFLNGKAAQHPIGSWFTADIRDALDHGELKFKPGVFPVPTDPGERAARVAVITGYQVNARTKYPKQAVELLELVLSQKYQSRFAELGNLSVRKDAPSFTREPLPKHLLGLLSAPADMIPPPDTGYSPERAAIFYEICAQLLLGRLDLGGAAAAWNDRQAFLARKEL